MTGPRSRLLLMRPRSGLSRSGRAAEGGLLGRRRSSPAAAAASEGERARQPLWGVAAISGALASDHLRRSRRKGASMTT